MVIDLQHGRTRMVVAIALAIAIHEIALSLIHGPATPNDREDQAVATTITFEKASPTPRPTPKPTPTPVPTQPPTPPPRVTIPPRVTPAPVAQIAGRAKGRPAKHRGGGAHRAVAKATHGTYANPHAAGSGTGTSTGQGAGNAPAVGGGLGGNGSGTSGNGNGAVTAQTPCGVVEFIPYASPHYENGTAYEPVKATVTFGDGHKEEAKFPYRWMYPNGEQNDPWSDTNLKNPDFPTTLKFPPPGTDTSGFDPLIKYILAHSDQSGFTDLPDCPKVRG